MAFEDEARRIGDNLLYLIPGNLREKSQYFREKHGINVPYSSYANLWSSLVSQIGVVDATRKILEQCIKALEPRAESVLRRSVREPVPQREIESLGLWFVIDSESGRASELGQFVLKYGTALAQQLGRLSAVLVYQISACINWLVQSKPGDGVVFPDGSVEKHGDSLILSHLRNLEQLLGTTRLASLELDRLHGLVDMFEAEYHRDYAPSLSEEHHAAMSRILAKIEAAVTQEITSRDFAELRPVTGILDYQKLPSEVLDSLLGDAAYSVPHLVRHDLEEAISCLRFGAPTASVMVGLRAVEGWLRELYTAFTSQKTRKGWAELLKEIQQILADKGLADAPVMGFLNFIRDRRNTADHPDVIFSQIEAEQTFVGATTAIRELEKLKGNQEKTT